MGLTAGEVGVRAEDAVNHGRVVGDVGMGHCEGADDGGGGDGDGGLEDHIL